MSTRNRDHRRENTRARAAETLGIIVIAVLIFAITVARFARTIHWNFW